MSGRTGIILCTAATLLLIALGSLCFLFGYTAAGIILDVSAVLCARSVGQLIGMGEWHR